VGKYRDVRLISLSCEPGGPDHSDVKQAHQAAKQGSGMRISQGPACSIIYSVYANDHRLVAQGAASAVTTYTYGVGEGRSALRLCLHAGGGGQSRSGGLNDGIRRNGRLIFLSCRQRPDENVLPIETGSRVWKAYQMAFFQTVIGQTGFMQDAFLPGQ
jgi:hypothetical protein